LLRLLLIEGDLVVEPLLGPFLDAHGASHRCISLTVMDGARHDQNYLMTLLRTLWSRVVVPLHVARGNR
jgi:hypothetical protein